jgi:biotin carboxyl carrier protein
MELIVKVGGRERRIEVRGGEGRFEATVDGRVVSFEAVAAARAGRSFLLAGSQHEVITRAKGDGTYWIGTHGATHQVEVLDPLTHLARSARGGSGREGRQQVTAYMPGRVVAVLVAEGEPVEAGQGVVVLEAMKMENEIAAERAGVLRKVHVATGQAVEGGDPLFEIE